MNISLKQQQYVKQLTEVINEKTSNSKSSSSSNTNTNQEAALNKTSIIVAICSVLVLALIVWMCVKIFSKPPQQISYPMYMR